MTAAEDRAAVIGAMADDIRRMSFRHGVPAAQIEALLKGAQAGERALDLWTDLDASTDGLAKLDYRMALSGSRFWIDRVRNSSGIEALFDPDLRFLSVSRMGRTLTIPGGGDYELAEALLLGRRFAAMLPTQDSFLGDDQPALDGLKARGLFDGKVAGVQIRLDLNFGFHVLSCEMDVWAVHTWDRGILGHSTMHRLDRAPTEPIASGVTVHAVTWF